MGRREEVCKGTSRSLDHWGSSRGILVVFWLVGTSNVLVFAVRLSCETPAACRPPGASHDNPRTPPFSPPTLFCVWVPTPLTFQNVKNNFTISPIDLEKINNQLFFHLPVSYKKPQKHNQKSTRRPPEREKKNENGGGRKKKKNAKFWAVRRRAVRGCGVRWPKLAWSHQNRPKLAKLNVAILGPHPFGPPTLAPPLPHPRKCQNLIVGRARKPTLANCYLPKKMSSFTVD